MNLYFGTFMTDQVDLQNQVFSWDALQEGAETAKGKPVVIEFQPQRMVGRVIDTRLIGNSAVEVVVDITDEKVLVDRMPFFVVPAGEIVEMRKLGETTEISHLKITTCSLTVTPTDPNLKPLQKVPS